MTTIFSDECTRHSQLIKEINRKGTIYYRDKWGSKLPIHVANLTRGRTRKPEDLNCDELESMSEGLGKLIGGLSKLVREDTIFDECVKSVRDRGFHDHVPTMASNGPLMAQMLRLSEEISEYNEAVADAMIHLDKMCEVRKEAADVVIVCAQIGHLLSANFNDWQNQRSENHEIYVPAASIAGKIARAMRKGESMDALAWTAALVIMLYGQFDRDGDFNKTIRAKLAADEERGHLHGDNQA